MNHSNGGRETHHSGRVNPETAKSPKKPFHPLLFFCFLISSTFLGVQQYLTYYNILWVPFGIALGLTIPTFIAIICTYA